MLAYSLRIKPGGLDTIGGEQFDNHLNVLSKILVHCVNMVTRQGMVRNYIPFESPTSMPHGRMMLTESIRRNTLATSRIVCRYDVFDENTYPNRTIKTVISKLLRSDMKNGEIKEELKKTYTSMRRIQPIDDGTIQWKNINYCGKNQYYRMALIVAKLISDGLLPNGNGTSRTRVFLNEDREWHLFESFVRGYFEVEYPDLYTGERQISWAIPNEQMNSFVPDMYCDIRLATKNRSLIIDTKWYKNSLSEYYGESYHSVNLYQIQSYVSNWNYANSGNKAEGLLLYAETDSGPINDSKTIAGNCYRILTLNLKGEWKRIDEQMRSIVGHHFGQ